MEEEKEITRDQKLNEDYDEAFFEIRRLIMDHAEKSDEILDRLYCLEMRVRELNAKIDSDDRIPSDDEIDRFNEIKSNTRVLLAGVATRQYEEEAGYDYQEDIL